MKYQVENVISFVQSLNSGANNCHPMIAFDSKYFESFMGSSSKSKVCQIDVDELNDILSYTIICNKLGDLFMVVMFEYDVYILMRASAVFSKTRKFSAKSYQNYAITTTTDADEDEDEDDGDCTNTKIVLGTP